MSEPAAEAVLAALARSSVLTCLSPDGRERLAASGGWQELDPGQMLFRSGEAMARTLGVSRASVWNALHALDTCGIEVFKVRGRGYRLAEPLSLLDLKQAGDVTRMAELQHALLQNAARLVRPGGLLIYSTCSLEREEGQHQIATFLAGQPAYERAPVAPAEFGADPEWITASGELRTLPFHMRQQREEMSGMDGFYVVRLRRKT